MREVSASELKELDPRAFEKEYYKWLEYCLDHDWTAYLIEEFKRDLESYDVRVMDVVWEENYGWRVAINGNMPFSTLIEVLGKKEQYLPLYLDALDYGSEVLFRTGNYRSVSQRIDVSDHGFGQTYPSGVFSDLPQEAWDELCSAQFDNEDWEELAKDWLEPILDNFASKLADEYDYLTSEEAFIESCEANDVTFEIEEEDHEV